MDVTAWTSERPQASVFKCGDCTKVYQSYSSFCRHRNVHSGVKYSCPRCGATFAVKNYVTQHLKRSKGCKQGSKTQKECAAAEKTRRPKKSLQCTSCNSRFANLPAMHRHTCKNLNVAYEIFLKEGQDVFDLDLGEPQAEEQPEYNIVMQWDELPWSVQFDVQPLQTDVQQEEEPLQTDVKQEPETLHTSFDVQQEEETLQVKQEPLQVQQEPETLQTDVRQEPLQVKQETLQTDVQQEEETLQVKQEPETLQTDVQQEPLQVQQEPETLQTDVRQEEETLQVKQEEEPLHTSFDVKQEEEEADAVDPLQELLRCCAEYNGRLMNVLNCYQ
jgi:uncharacterized C2H2 Zn-finger protein